MTLRVPKAETARVTERLLADLPVIDLTVEDPPIEEVIERVFAQEAAVRGLCGRSTVQQFKTTFASMLQYRAALVIWLIGHVLEPLIYLVVWSTVSAAARRQRRRIHDGGDFAAYFIVLMLVNHVTYTWIMYEYEYRVREGMLSFALLRPVHPIHADIADNISSKLITLPVMLLVGRGPGASSSARRSTSCRGPSAAFVPAVALAFLLRFLVEWTLALAAFWTTRVSAINQTYFVAAAVPLRPDGAAGAASPACPGDRRGILPFRWMIGFPGRAPAGQPDAV